MSIEVAYYNHDTILWIQAYNILQIIYEFTEFISRMISALKEKNFSLVYTVYLRYDHCQYLKIKYYATFTRLYHSQAPQT